MKPVKIYDTDSDNCQGGALFDDGAEIWWDDNHVIVVRPGEDILLWTGSHRLEPPEDWEGKPWEDALDEHWYDDDMVFTTELSYDEVDAKILSIITPKDENLHGAS